MELFLLFCVLNVLNVIIQTVKSLATVKCGKTVASLVNALAYGLYTIVLVYTMCDLPLMVKALVVAIANLIGVYIVKYFEEKIRKDRLWLVKITIPQENATRARKALEAMDIPNTTISTNSNYMVFDCYCQEQKDTRFVIELCKKCKGKAFATENKL